MDYYCSDMEYDVQLNQLDEDHEEEDESIDYQFHWTVNQFTCRDDWQWISNLQWIDLNQERFVCYQIMEVCISDDWRNRKRKR